MKFIYKNLDNKEVTTTLPIDNVTFYEIKNEVNGYDLLDFEDWAFWDMRDYFFNKIIMENFREDLTLFFTKVHLNKFDFKNNANKIKIKVVDVYYHYYYNEIFICAEPIEIIYPDIDLNRLEIHLKYNIEELEHLLLLILDEFGVSYYDWKKDGDDLSTHELEIADFFGPLMFDCWSKAKFLYKSDVIGLASYLSGGAGCVDLDNGNDIEETIEGITDYLKKRKKLTTTKHT